MIKDPTTLSDIRAEWEGVENLRLTLRVSAMASFTFSALGGIYPFALAKAAQNLPFIHACSVLNNALKALADEGCFSCKAPTLGPLVKSSKSALPWANYPLIKAAIDDRNEVAHEGKLLEKDVCWKHIDAIRSELLNWGVVV